MTESRDFPAGFLLGSSTAAHQVEGGNVNNDWWDFEHSARSPCVEPSGDGIDQWHRWPEDVELLAGLGQNCHRFSLEWSRIEPAPGEWSQAALDHYARLLDALHEHGLTPIVTLHHFTSPRWFAARGAWLAPDAVDRFAAYVEVVARRLGDRIPYACTINEPQIVAFFGYLLGWHAPGLRDPALWRKAGRTLAAAHDAALDLLPATTSAGLCLQLPHLQPARPDDPACLALFEAVRREFVDRYLQGLRGGFVGVQYYSRMRLDPAVPGLVADPPPGVPLTQMGWEIYPEGLAEAIQLAAGSELPVVITENGIATADDEQRIDYLEAHLRATRQAMDGGADVRGFVYWSSFDNFEWAEGYRPTFGLVGIDRAAGLRRVVRPSARAFARVARTGRIKALREPDV